MKIKKEKKIQKQGEDTRSYVDINQEWRKFLPDSTGQHVDAANGKEWLLP